MTAFKTLLATTAALGAAMMVSSAAQASPVFVENFESYNVTQHGADFYDLNFTAFTNGFHVEPGSGTVDLIGTPNAWSLQGASKYIDLDGSTGDGGIFRSDAFSFAAGDLITFQFDLAGNQRGGTDQWDYGFQTTGGFIDFTNVIYGATQVSNQGIGGNGPALGAGEDFLPSNSPWKRYSISFVAGSAGTATAYVATTSQDNIGPLVDNLRLSNGGVPEPATWGLMIMGFGGMGAVLRRRRAAVATA